MGWFDLSTLKEPYRLEGKKTMGLELAEQLGWKLPDVILYPTGGGTGLVGMWKAFAELLALAWLEETKLPRMVAVQSAGCAPIVNAFQSGEQHLPRRSRMHTRLHPGFACRVAVGDFMEVLDAVRQSQGVAIAVEDGARIVEWMKLGVSAEGVSLCPESAACIGAAEHLARTGFIKPSDQVVLFNCGAAQKHPHLLPLDLPCLPKTDAIDWSSMNGASM